MDEALKWGVLLACLAAFGCSTRTSVSSVGPTVPLASSDSIRFVQVAKETPYALLWPSKNIVNLWVHWDEKKTSALYPYPSCRARFNLALRGSQGLGGDWTGDMVSAWTESCTVTSATFTLAESGDTLRGWLSMEWTGDCGASRTTLPLTLARVNPTP